MSNHIRYLGLCKYLEKKMGESLQFYERSLILAQKQRSQKFWRTEEEAKEICASVSLSLAQLSFHQNNLEKAQQSTSAIVNEFGSVSTSLEVVCSFLLFSSLFVVFFLLSYFFVFWLFRFSCVKTSTKIGSCKFGFINKQLESC
jgi:hypothetical protein